jgi:hypothetical protein
MFFENSLAYKNEWISLPQNVFIRLATRANLLKNF